MAVKCDPIEADDRKYGQDSFIYEGFSSKGVSSLNVSTDLYSKSTTLGATFIKPNGTQGDSLKKEIRGLLEHAGFVGIEFTDYGTQSFSVSMPLVEGKGMVEMARALSKTVDIDRDTTHYAVLNAQDAQQLVIEDLKKRQQLSMLQAGVINVAVTAMDNTGGQRYGIGVQAPSYKDVDLSGLPGSAVESLREDGFVSKFAVEKHTNVKAAEGMGYIVQEKLEAAGFDVQRQENSQHMQVSPRKNGPAASADNIADALAGASLIPAQAAQDVKSVQAPAAPAGPAVAPVAVTQKMQAPAMR